MEETKKDLRWGLALACLLVSAVAAVPVVAVGWSWLAANEQAQGVAYYAGFLLPLPLAVAGFTLWALWDRRGGDRHPSSVPATLGFLFAVVALLGGFAVAYVQALVRWSNG